MKRSKELILRKFESRKRSGSNHKLKYLDLENLKKETTSLVVLEKLRNQKRGIQEQPNSMACNELNMSRWLYFVNYRSFVRELRAIGGWGI
jgi:hypothetical protein